MPEKIDLTTLNRSPHRRLNPLTGDWVLVSPQRVQRPWQGQVEKITTPVVTNYDPSCYLCPGNQRAGGVRNPKYTTTFSFVNDFSALLSEASSEKIDAATKGLVVAESESGTCKVVCFSPRHDLTLSRMTVPEISEVVDLWAAESRHLASNPDVQYVQIFENRGEMMGCSNPHPHGQIWASQSIPNEPRKEQAYQLKYLHKNNSCLLCDYLALEQNAQERIVCENDSFCALVPFWAVWPFEVLLISNKHIRDFATLDPKTKQDLADILKRITTRYDNLFETPFPYSMGFHQAPTDGAPHQEWHLHAHFYPPLLRSATVRKFMVGFEMLGSPQRDITPELAANRLREVSEQHYRLQSAE